MTSKFSKDSADGADAQLANFQALGASSPADLSLVQFRLNAKRQLMYTAPSASQAILVTPVPAFPFSAPGDELAIVDDHGKEQLWIQSAAQLEQLDAGSKAALLEVLRWREFRPTIVRINSVSTFTTPSEWQVDTQQGPALFVLKSEENIRRLPKGELLLTHSNGMQFVIPNLMTLDQHSRKLLARFM